MMTNKNCFNRTHRLQSVIGTLIFLFTLGVGNAWADTKTFDKNDSWDHTGTSGTGSATDIAADGLSVSTDKGYLDAGNHIRVYSGGSIEISSTAGAMTKIAFTSTASGTSNYGPSKISKNNDSNGSYSYSGKVGTWTYSSGATSVTFDASAQFRFTEVVITFAAATVSKTSITGLNYTGSGPSTAQSFTVAGTHVTGNLTVTAPTNFEVSKTSSTTGFASSVTLTHSSGTVSSTTIYVRLASGKSAGTYGGASTYVTVTGGGIVTKNVSVTGTVTAAVSCGTNPTAGSASLNSSFTLSSLTDPVAASTTSWTVGSNCSWTDYGFVWSDGANTTTPTLESNGTASSNCTKVQIGNSGNGTSWATSTTPKVISQTWVVGHTYYIRAYGKNEFASGSYQYTAAQSFTLRSVTFNSNGGSSVGPWYVKSGAAYSAPSAPTKTGYTFDAWYQEAGLENAVNWSSAISENKTYYAKWNAKYCTVTFDKNDGTGGDNSETATYDEAMPTVDVPTRVGYTFDGYWDSETNNNGSGTQYYKADGTSKINWDKDVTTEQTLYAKWTVKSFTVTWMVNGEAYTPSGSGGTDGSTSVNFGSHVTTLPTAPDPEDYCGQKFVGWTTTNIGAVGQATDAGLNLFTTAGDAPVINAEGAVTYYAVFADYDE